MKKYKWDRNYDVIYKNDVIMTSRQQPATDEEWTKKTREKHDSNRDQWLIMIC